MGAIGRIIYARIFILFTINLSYCFFDRGINLVVSFCQHRSGQTTPKTLDRNQLYLSQCPKLVILDN